jgi:diguanylate cyclase (GGDEF)-like protein
VQTRREETLAAGLARLGSEQFDAMLVDLQLGDCRGMATFFKVRDKASQLPIIILVELEDGSLGLETVKRGAQDSLLFGQLTPKLLAEAIRAGMEYKKNEARIREMAFQDPLTRLFNRRGFNVVAGHQLMVAQRTKNPLVLLFADVVHLEQINQLHGYDQGDAVLVEIGELMKKSFRRSDVMARLDADEFLLLAINCSLENAPKLIDRWNSWLIDLRAQKNWRFDLSLAFGTAAFDPESPCTLETLIVRAQLQMEEAKETKPPAKP